MSRSANYAFGKRLRLSAPAQVARGALTRAIVHSCRAWVSGYLGCASSVGPGSGEHRLVERTCAVMNAPRRMRPAGCWPESGLVPATATTCSVEIYCVVVDTTAKEVCAFCGAGLGGNRFCEQQRCFEAGYSVWFLSYHRPGEWLMSTEDYGRMVRFGKLARRSGY